MCRCERKVGGRLNILVAIAVAIIAIATTGARTMKTLRSSKTWDYAVLKDLARSYRQRVFLRRREISVASNTTPTIATTDSWNEAAAKPLDGIVVLVTGSTSGIGRSLVRWAFQQGASVVAMARSRHKLETLREELHVAELQKREVDVEQLSEWSERQNSQQPNQAGNNDKGQKANRFFPIVADMSDLKSVSIAVDVIKRDLSRAAINKIDIVVCNAGIWLSPNSASIPSTEQGYELTFGVNYLSHVLLTEKLMHTRITGNDFDNGTAFGGDSDFILSPITSRIVQVSSSYHMGVDGKTLAPELEGESEKKGRGGLAYGRERTNASPIASRVSNPQSTGNAGFVLKFLQHWFRGRRQYSTSKLAQLLHARISNRIFLSHYYGGENKIDLRGEKRVYVPFVSACPGWVGTHILRSTIDHESWVERLFHTLAYDVNGYGLSSILKAMFVPLTDLYDENSGANNVAASSERDDFFPNFGGFLAWSGYATDQFFVQIEYLSSTLLGKTHFGPVLAYFRDIVMYAASPFVVLIQPLFTTTDVHSSNEYDHTTAENLFTYRSSNASYNRTLQHTLHKWSVDAIGDFL
mmetsp:Transcript_23111/g.54573  ORF Transcript_23111/g.54573 Transcript_23111/m.54573 type:complete len:581 (-) Transcript_23111:2296-4038(-)